MAMAKGIDNKFVHYGIRRDDLSIIETICGKYDLDANWVRENILREYHSRRVDVIEMSDEETEVIIKNAIQQIK